MQATTVFSRNPYLVSLTIRPPHSDTLRRAMYKREAENLHKILKNEAEKKKGSLEEEDSSLAYVEGGNKDEISKQVEGSSPPGWVLTPKSRYHPDLHKQPDARGNRTPRRTRGKRKSSSKREKKLVVETSCS